MSDLSRFTVTQRWPAAHPQKLQLYSFPTPNGVKVSIALEETGLDYEAHLVDITKGDQNSPAFLSLDPNNKIPAIVDPNGPAGAPLALFESGAILLYLAERTGKLLPPDPALRIEAIQWVFFQVGGVGPMFGQFGFFHKAGGKDISDPRPRERYRDETRRLLAVLEQRLEGRDWLMGDAYTIADIATFPWVRALEAFYDAREVLKLDEFPVVDAWVRRCTARPASGKGLNIPARP